MALSSESSSRMASGYMYYSVWSYSASVMGYGEGSLLISVCVATSFVLLLVWVCECYYMEYLIYCRRR